MCDADGAHGVSIAGSSTTAAGTTGASTAGTDSAGVCTEGFDTTVSETAAAGAITASADTAAGPKVPIQDQRGQGSLRSASGAQVGENRMSGLPDKHVQEACQS